MNASQHKTLQKTLEALGLTEKEAKVYLANLEIGTNVVSKIAKRAKINRVTTYDILQKLTQKALVSNFTKNKLKYFTASDPDELLANYQTKLKSLKESIPELKQLTGETNHPKIRYFEGLEGIKKIYADTLTSKTDILNYANSSEIRKHWPEYDKEYVEKRFKQKIFLQGIALNDSHGQKVHSEDKLYNRETRLVPKEQFNFTNEINIYDNKVAIISFNNELIGTIIESPAIAQTQRAIFQMAWNFAGLSNPERIHQALNSKNSKNKSNKSPNSKTTNSLNTSKTPSTKTKSSKSKKKQDPIDPPPLKDQQAMF